MSITVDSLHLTESLTRLGGVETLVKQLVRAAKDSHAAALLDEPVTGLERAVGLRAGKYAGAFLVRRAASARFAHARNLIFHNFAGLMMLSGVIPHDRKCLFLHTNSDDVFSLLPKRLPFLDTIIVSGIDLETEIRERFPTMNVPIKAVDYPLEDCYFETYQRVPNKRLRIGYSGRLEIEQKQVLRLGDLSRNLLNLGVEFELEVAGSGSMMEDLRKSLPSSHCRLLGALDSASLHEAYKRWDFLICTSDYETGPLVAMEAMATGTLPILPDIPCQATAMIRNLAIPLYSKGDMMDAAQVIHNLIRSPEIRELRRSVIGKVSNRQIDRFIADIDSVLSETSSRPALGKTPPIPQSFAEYLPFSLRKTGNAFLR